ncbi:MAG: hypothetical protein V7K61_22935 [Nostoc sp.]
MRKVRIEDNFGNIGRIAMNKPPVLGNISPIYSSWWRYRKSDRFL